MEEKKRKYYINIRPSLIDDARDCKEIEYDHVQHRFYIKAASKLKADDFERRFNQVTEQRLKPRTDSGQSEIVTRISKVQGALGEMNIEEWNSFLGTFPTGYEIAEKITAFGIPDNVNIRIGILEGLNRSKKDLTQFPITFNALSRFSESFKSIYPLSYVQSLITENRIVGANLDSELIEKQITGEEAAILKFALEDI